MNIILHKSFKKDYIKLQNNIKEKFKNRKDLFLYNPYDKSLNNHSVDSVYQGCRSINVTGDYRVIFRQFEDYAELVHIGTHSQLYG